LIVETYRDFFFDLDLAGSGGTGGGVAAGSSFDTFQTWPQLSHR
jgi:hypothetical protein